MIQGSQARSGLERFTVVEIHRNPHIVVAMLGTPNLCVMCDGLLCLD